MMFELADYIAFVFAGLAGLGIGRVTAIAGMKRRLGRPAPAICETCSHGYGYHEDGGQCRKPDHNHIESCGCQRYVGPDPLFLGGS